MENQGGLDSNGICTPPKEWDFENEFGADIPEAGILFSLPITSDNIS